MDIYEKCDDVRTKEDLIAFIKSLKVDLDKNKDEWENLSLEMYLDAIEAWMTDTNTLSDKPNWNSFAQILLSGRFYE
ncbi:MULTISPECIES: DUF7660 family protein [Bacillus cereus group]|uniref:DUF7660 domain-containing protein n=1 Tax=Bacillus cereus TaxID=1396 RepID=A0AA44QDS6_BACCE|nr:MULTISPECIES: hypothetical protein [Bacillus cereus group]EEL50767.1 hypothetical protein bcere0022_19200 [Bacillus cereus Rock3-44]PFA22919.1 hypothetical protein CN373_07520 [Bacillus cereus]PFN06967.1 hypothetical protein COJ55_12280 [Bacillus cereus]PFO80535.1 hypothetical protein COJ77_17330 [Bacillus cereus]PFR24294.1 hypothetical protein COK19_18525 [Bacillus cereus]